MVLPQSLLPDGQRVIEQVRGLLVFVLVPAQDLFNCGFFYPSPPVYEGEDVEHGGHVGVVVPAGEEVRRRN